MYVLVLLYCIVYLLPCFSVFATTILRRVEMIILYPQTKFLFTPLDSGELSFAVLIDDDRRRLTYTSSPNICAAICRLSRSNVWDHRHRAGQLVQCGVRTTVDHNHHHRRRHRRRRCQPNAVCGPVCHPRTGHATRQRPSGQNSGAE